MFYLFTVRQVRSFLVEEENLKMALLANRCSADTELLDVAAEGHGEFVAVCELCGFPVFDGEEYHLDQEAGVYWHIACGEIGDGENG